MDRRRFLLTSLVGALVEQRAVGAQQAAKIWRIGYLTATTPELSSAWVASLSQGLSALGYVEGRNIVIEQGHASTRLEKLPDLAAQLSRRQPDVFVVHGSVHALPRLASSHRTPTSPRMDR